MPPAALGFIVNAPVLLGAWAAGTRAPHEAWQATVKGVTGTFLAPLVWLSEYVWLARRTGRRTALTIVSLGAAGGVATLVWHERLRRSRALRRLASLERDDPGRLADARRSREVLRSRVRALTTRAL
jgi:hypothetical protein